MPFIFEMMFRTVKSISQNCNSLDKPVSRVVDIEQIYVCYDVQRIDKRFRIRSIDENNATSLCRGGVQKKKFDTK